MANIINVVIIFANLIIKINKYIILIIIIKSTETIFPDVYFDKSFSFSMATPNTRIQVSEKAKNCFYL
jgi:hypothetical protein